MLCARFALRRRFYHLPRTGINPRRFDIGKFCRVTRDQRLEETVLQKYQRGVEANLTHEQPNDDAVEGSWPTLRDSLVSAADDVLDRKGKVLGLWRIGSALSHWWIDAISAIVIGCRLASIKAMNTTLGLRMPVSRLVRRCDVPRTNGSGHMLIGCRIRVLPVLGYERVSTFFVMLRVAINPTCAHLLEWRMVNYVSQLMNRLCVGTVISLVFSRM